jgi:hypothetical protein
MKPKLSHDLKVSKTNHGRWGMLFLAWVAGILLLYIAMHSPLREVIASLLRMKSRGCFFCTPPLTAQQVIYGVSGIIFLMSSLLAAWVLVERFDGPRYDRVLAFALYAMSLIVVPVAFIGEIGYLIGTGLLRPPIGPLLAAIPAALVVGYGLWLGWKPHRFHLKLSRTSKLSDLIVGLAIIMLLSSAAISAVHPPSGYDALSYHGPMAAFLWGDGNLGVFLDRAPGYWPLAHPGTAEIWLGLLRLIGGEPLANLAQLPFALLGSVGVYAFTRRLGLRHGAAQLSAAAFLITPMVVMQSGQQLNDLIGAALLMASFALVCAPTDSWTTNRYILIGLGLGMVVTTKLVLVPGAMVVGLFVLLVIIRKSRLRSSGNWVGKWLLPLAASFLIVIAPWWFRNILHYGNPVYPQALPVLGHGFAFASFNKADAAFVPRRSAWLIYPLLEGHDEQSGLGTLFAVCTPIGFAIVSWRRRRQPFLLFMAMTLAMLLSWWFLSERFPRFLLAPAGLCAAFVPWSLMVVPRIQRWFAATLLAVAAIFSALVTFDQALLPFAREPVSRLEFYDQVWGIDPAVLSLPASEGLLSQTGYAPDLPEYAVYYPFLDVTLNRLVLPVDRGTTTNSIITMMHQSGIHYAYVAASPEFRSAVETLFDSHYFELVSESSVVRGELIAARRTLFRSANETEENSAIKRYLFRLRQ